MIRLRSCPHSRACITEEKNTTKRSLVIVRSGGLSSGLLGVRRLSQWVNRSRLLAITRRIIETRRLVYKRSRKVCFFQLRFFLLNLLQTWSVTTPMPPTPRERFNAKARRSVAGGSSHKKRKVRESRKAEDEGQEHHDANAEILVEKTREENEQHRREFLRQEVCLVAFRVY
jgi:hypothetical protein